MVFCNKEAELTTPYRGALLRSSLLLLLAILCSSPTKAQTKIDPSQIRAGTFTQNFTHSGIETFTNLNGCIIVEPPTYALTNVGIQAAVNATPAGGCVFLPTGTYTLTATASQQIAITQPINFICGGWGTILQVGSSVGSIPVINITAVGVNAGIRIQDCSILPQSGTPGSYGIQVNVPTGQDLLSLVVEHVQVGLLDGNFFIGGNEQLGTGGIFLNGTGFLGNLQIEHSYIAGGILGTLAGDSITIAKNIIQGTGNGVDVSFLAGSAMLRIEDNTINPRTGAAIHIGGIAVATQITGNEMETPNSSGTGSNGAFVDIDGTSANPAIGMNVYNNSFQIVNSSTLNGLRINWASRANVRDNNFGLGVGAKDIVITANATNTHIRANNFNGATFGNAISDSSTTSLYEVGGQFSPDSPIAARDTNGITNFFGGGGFSNLFGQGVAGANYIYDGATNTVVGAFSNTAPVVTVNGMAKFPSVIAGGTAAVLTGTGACLTADITTVVAGAWAGNATCTNTTGASTLIITPGATAPHSWMCWASDLTTSANTLRQTLPLSATACTIAGTVNAADVLTFGAIAY
jgi:hypothetical protein